MNILRLFRLFFFIFLFSSIAFAADTPPRMKHTPELFGWSGSTIPDLTSAGTVTATTVAATSVVCTTAEKLTTDVNGNLRCATDLSTGGTTHDILSATHTDSNAGSVARGALIYGNSTPAWDKLAAGAANTLLKSDGTDVSWTGTPTVTSITASSTVTGTHTDYSGNARFTGLTANSLVRTNNGKAFESYPGYSCSGTNKISAISAYGVPTCSTDQSGASTLTDSHIFVGDASNVAQDVAMSGDVAISNTGVTTIQANAVALGTDTTGNYVATIADSGNSNITVANSGAENAGVTLDVVDVTCTGCLGTTEIAGLDISDDTNLAGGTNGIDMSGDTINFDATEVSDVTWGSGSGFTWTFNAGATDPTLAFASTTVTLTPGGGDFIVADDLELQDASPHIVWTDTTASEDDFELYGDANTFILNNKTDLVTIWEVTTSNQFKVYAPTIIGNSLTLSSLATGILQGNGASAVSVLTTSAGIQAALSDEDGTGGLLSRTAVPLMLLPQGAVLDDGSPPALSLTESTGVGTARRYVLGFDATSATDEKAYWTFTAPIGTQTNGAITMIISWYAASTTANADAIWAGQISCTTAADADSMAEDAAMALTATDTVATNVDTNENNRLLQSTLTLSSSDNIAAGDICTVMLMRDSDDSIGNSDNDGLSVDANVVLVELRIP